MLFIQTGPYFVVMFWSWFLWLLFFFYDLCFLVIEIEIRNIWKFRIECFKKRDFSSCCVAVRYIPNTSCRVKIRHLEYCSFADGSVIKINDGKIGHATIAHCETSQNLDEVHSELLFDDSEEGKLVLDAFTFNLCSNT